MEFFLYLIKVNVAIALFYGLYRLFLGRDTFFSLKRFALLSALFFSLFYPLMSLPEMWTSREAWTELTTNNVISVYLDEIIVSAQAPDRPFFGINVLTILYLIGVGVLLIRMMIELTNVLLILYQSSNVTIDGQTVRVNEKIDMPFSFFGCIVINPGKHTQEELKEILLHETTHVRQAHSVDTVLSELFCIAFWFNPFMWLIRHEIRMNLEYLADKRVVDTCYDSRRYQFHLLRLTYNKAAAKLINNFNVSPLKQRIFMMNKQQTKQWGLMKYLLFVPAIAALFFFNLSVSNAGETPQDVIEIEMTEPVSLNESTEDLPRLKVRFSSKEQSLESVNVRTEERETDDTPPPPPPTKVSRVIVNDDADVVFERAETMPQFPGGDAALYEWLAQNIVYPKEAVEKKLQGTVTLRFIVKKTGEVGDVQILRGVNELLDQEALRVVKALPNFIPGKQKGEPVAVWFNLPVRFKL